MFSLAALPCLSFSSLTCLRFESNLLTNVLRVCTVNPGGDDNLDLGGDDDLDLGGDDDLDLGHQSNQLIEKLGDQQP